MDDVNPYEAPSASVDNESEPEGGTIYGEGTLATRGSRLGAKLIDNFSIGGSAGLLIEASNDETMLAIGLMLLMVSLGVIALNLYWLHQNGQTIGKRALGIKIVRSDRSRDASLGRILFARATPAAAVKAIPMVGRVMAFADVLFIFGSDRRCLHDYVADTTVIVDGTDKDVSYTSDSGNTAATSPGNAAQKKPEDIDW